ncbi:MAG: hypothetical protein IKW74_07725, partial [Thermoguttaceae bacterium]|nr:hypothetical protein [Thermoguttaceae bacterium]
QSYDIETVNIDGTAQYIVTWAAGTSSDTNLFAKRFTVTDDYAITEQQSFMVSTEVGNQILPQIAVADNGDYYIAWSSNQNKNTSYDIYARGYTITGESKTLLGSTSEVQINTYALNIQTNPTIAVAPNGSGVVISWQSFDEEIDNVDMTVPGGQQLYDYGIVARVFNADGNPVNVVDASLSVGQEVDFGEGEFVVNSIVNGEQVTPAAGMSDWVYNLESSLYEPLFVVAWVGPGTMTQLDTETGGDSGDDADITIYSGEYQVFYKRYPAKSGTVTDDLITQKSYSSYVTDVSASSGIQGFYRPTDNGMALVSATENSTDEELYYVVGTTGDDVIEINIGSGRAKSSVTLNGENVAIPANATRIVVNAHAGNDKIVVNGRVTSAAVNATMNSLSIESDVFDVTVTGIENVVLAADSAESLTVQTTKSNDTVVIGPGSLELSGGNGFAVTATGFNSIAARSVTGSDIAILKDSEEDDTLTMQNGYAKITNGQYVNEAAGFSTVRAIASTGNDVAVLTEAQTLQAMLGSVIAKTSASVNIAMRFVTVDVTGTGAATIIGSMGGDALTCDGAGASLVYSDQTRISVNGFATINVDGNGGYDSAFVTGSNAGRNIFTGRQNIATMTNGRYSRTLRDFAHVEVFGSGDGNYEAVLYDTDADDVVTADKSSVRMSANGNEIYSVLAFDQVSVKKERYSGNDTVQAEETLDYLFASEGWNNE